MNYIREGNNAWILPKHYNDFDLMLIYAKILKEVKELSKDVLSSFSSELIKQGIYNPRWGKELKSLSATTAKIDQLSFFMFGYKHKNRFIYSELANLLLDNLNNVDIKKRIVLCMLYGVQFNHPHNKTNDEFRLFPIRLVFKLLLDPRIKNRLYTSEILYFIYFIKDIDSHKYEQLVEDIIEYRMITNNDKVNLFYKAKVGKFSNINKYGRKVAQETWWANKIHEWDMFFTKTLNQIGILNKKDGELIHKFQHGLGIESGKKQDTFRKLKNNYIELSEDLIQDVNELDKYFSCFETPINIDENILDSEFKSRVFSFFPTEYISSLNLKNNSKSYILFKPIDKETQYSVNDYLKNISIYANDGQYWEQLEIALETCFKTFNDIKAERVGGAGRTDVECIYITTQIKFAVEAKSTKNKFDAIQTSTLFEHREKINAKYTVLFVDSYSPKVIRGIKNENIVILQPSIFAKYLSNLLRFENNPSYNLLNQIIEENIGEDISEIVEELTFVKYAHVA